MEWPILEFVSLCCRFQCIISPYSAVHDKWNFDQVLLLFLLNCFVVIFLCYNTDISWRAGYFRCQVSLHNQMSLFLPRQTVLIFWIRRWCDQVVLIDRFMSVLRTSRAGVWLQYLAFHILQDLHWILVHFQIRYKISTFILKVLAVPCLYLADLLSPCEPTHSLHSFDINQHIKSDTGVLDALDLASDISLLDALDLDSVVWNSLRCIELNAKPYIWS